MDAQNVKIRPLTKEETKVLLSLVELSTVINNKTTNATSNKMKNEEWVRITDTFNATSLCRRTPQQLRLKWENLKKNARKRSTTIRMNRLKTGGGPPEYIPPDDILDRVSTLLGSTVDGLTVELGGDAEPSGVATFGGDGGDGGDSGDGGGIGGAGVFVEYDPQKLNLGSVNLLGREVILEPSSSSAETPVTSKLAHTNTPRASGFKRKLVKSDEGRQERNLALARYYNIKAKTFEAKLESIILENEKLKLEIDQLKKK